MWPRMPFRLARIFIVPVLSVMMVIASMGAGAADTAETFAIAPQLSPEDVSLYQRIFAAQSKTQWRTADRLAKKLQNRVLMGHVLQERLMHPSAYRASYEDLHNWMKRYADHPGADRVFALASKRRPKRGWKQLTRPKRVSFKLDDPVLRRTIGTGGPKPYFNKTDRSVINRVKRLVRRTRPTAALRLIEQQRRRMTPDGRGRAGASVVRGYLSAGLPEKAFAAGRKAATNGKGIGGAEAAFMTGIAAEVLGREADARTYFKQAAGQAGDSDTGTAASFWAARSALSAGAYHEVLSYLQAAAASGPRSYYGMLAARQLAWAEPYRWQLPGMTRDVYLRLGRIAGVQRAIALNQVGRNDLADMELRALARRSNRAGGRALLAFATLMNTPATALRLARYQRDYVGEVFDAGLFPLAEWAVDPKHRVDRALVFAIARRESGFNIRAKSRVGARGLMQIMPSTARYIGQSGGPKIRHRNELFNAEQNLAMGGHYVRYLLNQTSPDGNLVEALVSYNAGPGNARSWRKRPGGNDPVLFLETLPSAETRHFAKTVLRNLWMYRSRLDQDAPSLDRMAEGRWPIYEALDSFDQADNGQTSTATGQ